MSEKLRSSSIQRFTVGFFHFFKGFSYLGKHRLWGLARLAIGVNVLLFVLSLVGLWFWLYPELNSWEQGLATWGSDGWWSSALATVLTWSMWVLAVVVCFLAGGALVLMGGQALASPILDKLSERVEMIEAMPVAPNMGMVRGTWMGLAVSFRDLFWGLAFLTVFHMPLFLLSFITVLGVVVVPVISVGLTSLLFAHEFIGMIPARRFMGYRARWGVIRRHKWEGLGFGLALVMVFFVPFLNLVLLPVAAVSGSLLFCDLQKSTLVG